ncbi:MAG: hypothetical protein ACFFG0_03155 [Candidatus Thorarchaeota archaeon]
MDKINLNRQRISNIQKNIGVKKSYIDEWKYSWNFLMLNYGWIPKEEFLNLDAQDVEELIQIIIEIKEKNKPNKK